MTPKIATFHMILAVTNLWAITPSTAEPVCSGRWRVIVQSADPTCNAGNLHHVQVDKNGVIMPDRPGHSYVIRGLVSDCKSIVFTITRQAETVRGDGTVSDGIATGTWEGTNAKGKTCSGDWTAAPANQ